MMACISVRNISLQSTQGLVSIAAAAGTAADLACFDIAEDNQICKLHRRLNTAGETFASRHQIWQYWHRHSRHRVGAVDNKKIKKYKNVLVSLKYENIA